MSQLGTCVALTASLVGIAATLSWTEFSYLQRTSTRDSTHRRPLSHLVDARIGVICGVGLLASGWIPEIRFALLVILASMILQFARRVQFGREGSDEIAVVIVLPMALATIPGSRTWLQQTAMLFVAAQLILAYLASAGAKLAGVKWRDGRAVAQVLSTRDYGLEMRGLYQRRSPVFKAMAWSTIGLEFFLPVGFGLGGPLLPVAVLLGIAFHGSVALLMGLNRFFPWFLAAYPAAVWASLNYGLLSH